MVELIHFLLGGNAQPTSIFRSALKQWTFHLNRGRRRSEDKGLTERSYTKSSLCFPTPGV